MIMDISSCFIIVCHCRIDQETGTRCHQMSPSPNHHQTRRNTKYNIYIQEKLQIKVLNFQVWYAPQSTYLQTSKDRKLYFLVQACTSLYSPAGTYKILIC